MVPKYPTPVYKRPWFIFLWSENTQGGYISDHLLKYVLYIYGLKYTPQGYPRAISPLDYGLKYTHQGYLQTIPDGKSVTIDTNINVIMYIIFHILSFLSYIPSIPLPITEDTSSGYHH